jgi:hypothetical protein
MTEPPKTDPPKTDPPKVEPPKVEPPKEDPNKARIVDLKKLIDDLESVNAGLRRKVESVRPKDRMGIKQSIADNEMKLAELRKELSSLSATL